MNQQPEDKTITILRRKFLFGIPSCAIGGYVLAKLTAAKFGLSRWPTRGLKIAGALLTPLLGSMLIVHFNKAEIFRAGGCMLRQMEQLRKLEEGPFADPMMRSKWDEQMANRKFNLMRPDENIAKEFESSMDYSKIVDDSIRRLYDKMMKMGLIGAYVIGPSFSLDNGLARTPPMGWLSWQRYGCDVDAKLIRDTADAMTAKRFNFEKSLEGVGYKYVNIDDCWSLKERDSNGDLIPDPEKFPKHIDEVADDDGMKSVSQYLHKKKLFFGLYTDIGTTTCQKYPSLAQKRPKGSPGEPTYLEQDVKKFVEWGIDALKVDGCNANISEMGKLYSELSDELMKQTTNTRRILLSCSWPAYRGREGDDNCENEADMEVLVNKCNLWRNFVDIQDSWSSVRSIVNFWARRSPNNIMVKNAGPGHWNDPDMLVIGNPGLSISEQKAQFALWAIIAAPLYMSVDVAKMPEESYRILMNEKVIAINQDPAGKQGFVAYDEQKGSRRTWFRLLSAKEDGRPRIAVLFENKSSAFNKIRMTFKVQMLGWMPSDEATYTIEDVHTDNGPIERPSSEAFTVDVDESSVEMFVFTWIGPPGSADPDFFAEDKHLAKGRRTRRGASTAVLDTLDVN